MCPRNFPGMTGAFDHGSRDAPRDVPGAKGAPARLLRAADKTAGTA